ncbi:MAG: bifunctional folylpolyglutamate synthase/dihydrofolate synthase [Acidobacteria bacterium]|nr:bifunctional folylpolyglutamate synthase/dihydrofolate synthase [Acidobacteriota bacterium]
MTYAESLTYLEALGTELKGRKFGLEKIRLLLQALGSPERTFRSVLVAGTNGKGSTSAFLAGILSRSGIRTGLFTSPHLVRVNERIQVDGREISDDGFAAAFSRVAQQAERLQRENDWPEPAGFFEFLTAAALVHFARTKVEIAVLEVGLGGRLDATVLAEPILGLITNIDYDHENILGSTLGEIAREKAGIIWPGRPVLHGCEEGKPAEVIRARAKELGAECADTGSLVKIENEVNDGGQFTFDLGWGGERLPDIRLGLRGRFQVRNAAAAAAAAWKLRNMGWKVTVEAVRKALEEVRWPGRLEAMGEHPLVLLDGAHNPAAAREVAEFVRENIHPRKVRLLYASMRDKNVGKITEILFPLAEKVYLTRPHLPRAISPQELARTARSLPTSFVIEDDPAKALDLALRESDADDVILVVGSLFLVGEVRRAFEVRALQMTVAGMKRG